MALLVCWRMGVALVASSSRINILAPCNHRGLRAKDMETLKFRVTFKTPDVVEDRIKDTVQNLPEIGHVGQKTCHDKRS